METRCEWSKNRLVFFIRGWPRFKETEQPSGLNLISYITRDEGDRATGRGKGVES